MRRLIVAIAALAACAPGAQTGSPTPTSTDAATVAPTATESASAAPTSSPTPSPVGLARYTSAALGYSVDLPPGWHRAVCSAGMRTLAPLSASDFFVNMPESEEVLGIGLRAVSVRVEQAEGRTPLAWLQAGGVVGQGPLRYETASLDGRSGARAVEANGDTIAFVLAARGWIYAIEKGGPVLDAETETQMSRILPTLRILDEATLGRGAPTPLPRSAESLVAGLADGFARGDVPALTQHMAPCLTVGAIPGGAATLSRAAYANNLSRELWSGVTVRVRSQIETDPTYGRFVRSTWSRPGQPDQRVDLLLRADGERWSWSAVFQRAP